MAEARSDDEKNSLCTVSHKRRLEAKSVLGNETENRKKMKHETLNDFQLVKILAENARNKTLILHLQGIWNILFGTAHSYVFEYVFIYLCFAIWHNGILQNLTEHY